MLTNWRSWSLVLALALGAPAASWAQGVIQSITSSQQGGGDVVRIEMSEALKAVPSGFVIQQPPRVAIDLPLNWSRCARWLTKNCSRRWKNGWVIPSNRSVIALNRFTEAWVR